MDDLARKGLLALGRRPAGAVHRLAGDSGSGVFRLGTGTDALVLKVTDGDRQDARREVSFYQQLADKVPVRTPRLVDARCPRGQAGEADLTVLLVTPAEAVGPASSWSRARWLEVASQLGALHQTLDRAGIDAHPWLRRQRPETSVAPPERVSLWGRNPLAPVALPLLADLERLRNALHRLPLCLLHGDCHAQNLLRDADDHLVWADWAEVGSGRGPEDLAILWQRAEFDGATVPREPMLAAYAQARSIGVDDVLRDAVRAGELLMILLGWPAFLLERPSTGRDSLFRRFELLAQN